MGRLGRTGQVQVAGGILAFIVSFLPWIKLDTSLIDEHHNAWQDYAGAAGWFTWLLLLGLGAVAVLSALQILPKLPLALIGVFVSGLVVLILLLHWANMREGLTNAWGYYLELVIAIAVGVFSYLGMSAEGSSFSQIGAYFQSKQGPSGPPPGQG